MRCKPGDLAVFVRGQNVGGMCRVIGPAPAWVTSLDTPGWEVEALSWVTTVAGLRNPPGFKGWTEDRNLRPIRNPGDDAQDETLAWLPSPGKVTEAA